MPDSARSGRFVTATALGAHLDLTRQRISQLADEGVIQRDANGFDIDASRIAYLRWLRDSAKRAVSPAEERLREAKAELVELRVAEQTKRLVKDAEDHFLDFLDEVLAPLKPDLLGIPARVTKDLALRRTLEREIEGSLTRAADRMKARADQEENHGRR